MKTETIIQLATLAAIGGTALYLFQWLRKNPGAFNPASDKNLAYQGANKILQTVTGNKVDSVGTAAANVFKSDAEKSVDAMLRAPVISKNVGITVNPFDSGARRNTGAEILDTVSPYMYGLGEIGAARFRNVKRR